MNLPSLFSLNFPPDPVCKYLNALTILNFYLHSPIQTHVLPSYEKCEKLLGLSRKSWAGVHNSNEMQGRCHSGKLCRVNVKY